MYRVKPGLCVLLSVMISIAFSCPIKAESATSAAERLLMVAPDNMVGFIATSGGDDLKPAFDKTIMGRMWNDPGVQSFYQSVKQELLNKIKQEIADPNDIKTFEETIVNFAKLALSRPLIIGGVPKDTKVDKCPVYGFAILDAGTRKAEIASAITKLEALADNNQVVEVQVGSHAMHELKDNKNISIYWGWIGNYCVFAINDAEGLAVKHLRSDNGRPVPDYLSKVPPSCDALAVYLNYEKVFNIFHTIAAAQGSLDDFNSAKMAMKELGFDNIRTIVSRNGFAGPDIVCNSFVEVSGPRTGLLAHLKSIELSMFDMVDARAMNTAAANCDFAGIYDTITQTIKVSSPNDAYPDFQEAIAKFESEAKFSIRKDLLQSLSGQMLFYTLPAGVMMESPAGGTVLIAKLKDPALFEKTMTALQDFAAAKRNGMLQISSQVQNGNTLHICAVMPLAMMQIMPTWTIVNGHLVFAANTSLCNLAVTKMQSPTNNLPGTAAFKKVTANLPANLLSLRYVDSTVQFNRMMMAFQQFWPMATMGAANAGVKLPFVLPNLSNIANDMQPSCEYSWFDSQGLRAHYKGTGVEQSMASVAGVAMAAGILMPALARTRQLAYRTVSATNLSAIGKACLIYANDHNETYPANLQVLVEKADLPPMCLISKFKPKDSTEPSYIYIPGQNATMKPQNIIAYENPAFCTDKINVLFNDCHVQAMTPEEFLKELEATYKSLGQKMPDIKFKSYEKPQSPVKPQPPRTSEKALRSP